MGGCFPCTRPPKSDEKDQIPPAPGNLASGFLVARWPLLFPPFCFSVASRRSLWLIVPLCFAFVPCLMRQLDFDRAIWVSNEKVWILTAWFADLGHCEFGKRIKVRLWGEFGWWVTDTASICNVRRGNGYERREGELFGSEKDSDWVVDVRNSIEIRVWPLFFFFVAISNNGLPPFFFDLQQIFFEIDCIHISTLFNTCPHGIRNITWCAICFPQNLELLLL